MVWMNLVAAGVIGAGALAAFARGRERLRLSRAKHASLIGHPRIARRLARLLPYYEYSDPWVPRSDGAPADVAERRARGFEHLAAELRARAPETARLTAAAESRISDLQFTATYRVPFQYRRYVGDRVPTTGFVRASSGVRVEDLDGNEAIDLTGSYGVNLLGYDFYKGCIERGSKRATALGPVLGPYHPDVEYNVRRLCEISGLDEVSFHMSGTEAVMQAVRLARYHTGRTHLVRFAGAYHGWWGDVQPGPGNPQTARETYTLSEMDERTLEVLRRRRDIACVLVNPLQAMAPNQGPAGDSTLLDGRRPAEPNRAAYAEWLGRLRQVCTEREIPLLFDEVFVGFRLAPGGAQEYFGVRADMVTYGKTLGGGLPVGALCGRADLMRRFTPDRPADLCFARGTFNSHPAVMATTREFLEALDRPEIRELYRDLDERWDRRAEQLNGSLLEAGLPVRVRNLSTIWTVAHLRPSRFHWMLQFYLRAEGLLLSWTGTGRLIFSLDFGEADFEEVVRRFVAAARRMEADGWWWQGRELSEASIRRTVAFETVRALFHAWPSYARPRREAQAARGSSAYSS